MARITGMRGSFNPLAVGVLGLLVFLVLTFLAVPASRSLVEQWANADIQSRARLISRSVQGPVRRALADGDQARLASILDGVAEDERVMGLAI